MRHTEFWSRMEQALGEDYHRHWAQTQVLAELDARTPAQALEEGVAPQRVWRAVWAALELPETQR